MKPVKLPGLVKFLLGVLSGILCVALFASCLATITLANVRSLTTEENMKTIVQFVLFGGDTNSVSVLPQAVGVKLDEPSSEEGGEASDLILDLLYDLFKEQVGEDAEVEFTTEDIQNLLDQSTLPEFFSDKVAGIMTDVLTGEVTTTITGAEVGQLLEDNKALIEETLGIELTEEYKSAIMEKVNEMDMAGMMQEIVTGVTGGEGENGGMPAVFANGVLTALLSGEATIEDLLAGGLPAIMQMIREITSEDMMNLSLLVCVILAAMLLVVNIVQLHEGVRCIGLSVMLAALPFAAASIAAMAAPSLFTGFLSLAYITLMLNAGLSIGVFVGGLVLVIVSFILGGIYKKKLEEA